MSLPCINIYITFWSTPRPSSKVFSPRPHSLCERSTVPRPWNAPQSDNYVGSTEDKDSDRAKPRFRTIVTCVLFLYPSSVINNTGLLLDHFVCFCALSTWGVDDCVMDVGSSIFLRVHPEFRG